MAEVLTRNAALPVPWQQNEMRNRLWDGLQREPQHGDFVLGVWVLVALLHHQLAFIGVPGHTPRSGDTLERTREHTGVQKGALECSSLQLVWPAWLPLSGEAVVD
jgi:hypothetical protein